MYHALDRSAGVLARIMALLAGAILIAITVVTCASIIGRALVPLDIGLGPIRGIYDITEIGMATAVFAFLPLCQYRRGHASVDLLLPVFPKTLNRLLDLLFDIGMLVVATVMAWRLYLGMMDKYSFSETTLIAQIPVWQGYAASLVGAVAFALVAAFCVVRSLWALNGAATKGRSHV